MPKLVTFALFCTCIGMLATLPCLIRTTPLTMIAFFAIGMPLFAVGFVLYLIAVIRDLRSHKVI